ncbi:aldo/keto reductase [Cryomorphaceae bacterium]|nr:aldo/keto reductase [Cryomorphaceae bacterium]
MSEPRLILGTMRWGAWGAGWSPQEQGDRIAEAVEMGIDHFDLADIYGEGKGEAEFGTALQDSGADRSRLTLITKCGIVRGEVKHYNTTFEYIRTAAQRSLEHLQTDYLDMLLIHRPDPLMVYEEIAHAFQSLQEEGLLEAAGTSNFLPHQWDLLNKHIALETNQIEWSLTHLDPIWNGQLDQLAHRKKRPQIWGPLGGGKLTDIAEPGEVLQWMRRHPSNPLPIVGSTKPERWKAFMTEHSEEMSRERWFEILEKARGHRIE